MAYLIIPIIGFVLIGGLFWVILAPSADRVRKGTIDDLDVYLSVLMTAEWDRQSLLIKVPRRVTSLTLTLPDSAVRFELPLVTRLQRSRSESYLAMLRELGVDAQISEKAGGHDVLEGSLEGSPTETALLLKKIALRLFDVNPDRAFEFRVTAHVLDLSAIDRGLQEKPSGEETELPIAGTQGRPPEALGNGRETFLKLLAGVLLMPVLFMVAYLQFGIVAASTVLAVILIAREAHRRWKRAGLGFYWADAVKLVALTLTSATLYFGDPVYLQLVPTAGLLIVAATELAAVIFKQPPLFAHGAKSPIDSRTSRILISLAIIATGLGGAAMNEVLRLNITLDAWMWCFSFVRIELFFGFLVSATPWLVYMVKRMPEMNGNAASQ